MLSVCAILLLRCGCKFVLLASLFGQLVIANWYNTALLFLATAIPDSILEVFLESIARWRESASQAQLSLNVDLSD